MTATHEQNGKPFDTDKSSVFERMQIVNAERVVCAFMMPVSPAHATVLYDKYGAKGVEKAGPENPETLVIFDMPATIEYIRAFCKKAMETVEENLDKDPTESAAELGQKLGLK